MAYTLAELRVLVRTLLNEAVASFWADADLDGFLAEGAVHVSALTSCVEATQVLALQEGVRSYSVASDHVEALHIQEDATGRGLLRISPSIAGHTAVETTGPTPLRWYEFARAVWVEPIPDATAAGTNVRLFYARVTDDVTLLPMDCQVLALDFALYRALQRDRRYAEAASVYSAYLNGAVVRGNGIYARTPHTVQDVMIADVPLVIPPGG